MKLSQRMSRVKPSPTLALTALAASLQAQGIDIIGFGAGEPDYDTPQNIKDAAKKAIDAGKTKYTPVGGIKELKEAIINKFKRDNNLIYSLSEVTVNCGGKHSFFNLMQVIIDEGDEVIVPAPYWVSYPPMVLLAGGIPIIVDCPESTGFKLTPKKLKESITPKTRAVVFNSPSNPTGSAYSRKELEALAAVLADRDIIAISDDIYESITYDGFEFSNMANISSDMKLKTIVLNGVSKVYSMTGWRIGYMAGDATVIKNVETYQSQSTSNPTSIAQWAALEGLSGDQSVINEMVTAFKRRRGLIVNALNKVPGFSCINPDGAFYAFPSVKGVYSMKGWDAISKKYEGGNSSKLCSYLIDEARVAVVPGIDFGNDDYLRLSFATSDEKISKGIERIAEAVSKLI
jgi:aspartate aminotransferase